MKNFILIILIFWQSSLSAQTFNHYTGGFDEMKDGPQVHSAVNSAAKGMTGIPCNPGTFWANDYSGNIIEYALAGNVILATGTTYSSGGNNGLAFANSFSGSAYSPTFYSPTAPFNLIEYDGISWNVFDTSDFFIYNGGGYGNDLYFMNTGEIIHYDQNGFDSIYSPPFGTLIAIADVAVDQAGNVYFIEKTIIGDSLVILSSAGIVLKKMHVSITDYSNAYGCFLLNGIFYIGFGGANLTYGSTLVPIIISGNTATAGTPIPFPLSAGFADLESCNPGYPLGLTVNLSSSDTTFCDKQCLDFTDLSTNNPISWQWLFPGGVPSSSTQQNPTGICYNSFGSFDVTLIACNAIACDTLFLPGFINELQNPPPPVITWSADTLYSTPAYSYQWYLNSISIPGATDQYYVFQQPGNYYVIVTDSNGCAASSFVIYTGIEEMGSGHEISIIPNPSDGNFIISGAPVNATIKIYNPAGQVIYMNEISFTEQRLKLQLPGGIYFLEIISHNQVSRKKMLVKR